MQRDVLPGNSDVASADAAVPDQSRRDELGSVDADGEADSLGHGNDRRIHADDLSTRIDQRAAGVPGIEGGVGLDHAVDQSPALGAHGPA